MLTITPLAMGKLLGTIYDFPETGDVLPMHWHTEENVHITIVTRGSFKATGPNWDKIVKAGDVVDWQPMQQHEFVSVEPNSRIVNIVKGNGPSGNEYGELPQ